MSGTPGKGGRTPKRSTERAGHRTKAELAEVESLPVAGNVEAPPLGFEPEDPMTTELYAAAIESGQTRYYEPTDWHLLRFLLRTVDAYLVGLATSGRPNAKLFDGIMSGFNTMLYSESERRRIRLEIERDEGTAAVFDFEKMYRERLTGN